MRSFLCLLLLPTVLLADDWPQFLGPNRDGVSKEKNLRADWPKDGPRLLWKRGVGPGYAGPVVQGDRLILFHSGPDKEIVECLKASTGKALWSFDYLCEYRDGFGKGNGPRATPVIAGDRVVTYGAEGVLTCLDLESGKKLWQRDLTADYKVPNSYFGVGTSPVVWDGRVLVNVGGKDAGIVAFSLAEGKELWKATRDTASYSSPVMTTVGGEPRAIFFTREGAVYLDPASGKVLFQKRWRARNDASVNAATPLVLPGDKAFFSSSYDTGALLLKLKKDGADEVWTDGEAMSNHYNTAVFSDGHLYGIDGRQEAGARLRCIDPNGAAGPKVMWSKEGFGCAGFVLADGVLFALTELGDLVAIEPTPRQYRERARAHILERTRSQPALANGVFFARDGESLVAIDLKAK